MELMRCKAPRVARLALPLRCNQDACAFTLRSYQMEGFNWLVFLREHHLHGILADDMGLGKTVQTLCAIATAYKQATKTLPPSIVLCPSSLVMHWKKEFDRFFSAPSPHGWNLKAAVYTPHVFEAKLRAPEKIDTDAHLFIASYGTVSREFGSFSKAHVDGGKNGPGKHYHSSIPILTILNQN